MASILFSVFNVVVALLVPLGILVWFIAKKRSLVLPFLIGALTFFVSQMVLRLPLMQALSTQSWYAAFAGSQPALYSILLGLSAGVFEEVGRFISMSIMKRHHTWGDAVSFGIGHGGIEAILLVGVNYLVSLFLQRDALIALPATMVLAAGVERISAMLFHVGASVMVMRGVQSAAPGKKLLWLGLAILAHTVLDGMLGILQMWGVGVFGLELYVAVAALGMLAFTLLSRPKPQQTASEVLPNEENG